MYQGEYIQDHPEWTQICEIPESAAKEWLRTVDPNHQWVTSWLNKGYIIVDEDLRRETALYFHDFHYWIYRRVTPR